MNVIVNSQVLAAELRLLSHVVSQKPSLPILANALVRAESERLTFVGTDMEVAFRTSCPALVSEVGTATVPAQRLLALVEQLRDDEVRLVSSGSHVEVSSGSLKSRLQAFSADDFPVMPEPVGESSTLPVAALQALIGKVRFAVTDKSKYISNGALLSLTDTVVALVATDGKRLSIATMPRAVGALGQTIVSAKALDALASLFAGGQVVFSKSDRHLFFSSNGRLLVSRVLEAQFPSYDRIIPRDSDKHVEVDRTALAAALRRVAVLSEESQATYFLLEENQLTLSASSAEAGDAVECLPVTYRGSALKACCSWRYVLDFLEAATDERITLDCKTDTTPFLLSEGSTFINVVMLMRG